MEGSKPIKVKPALYAHIYYGLKEIARNHGYNLVLHGSLDRDFDLIAIPWKKKFSDHLKLMKALTKAVKGDLMKHTGDKKNPYVGREIHPVGRRNYVINLRRGEERKGEYVDLQYYIDISVITPV